MSHSPSARAAVDLTWCLTESLHDDVVGAAIKQLSADERQRHDRFMFERDRREFALAHALQRRCLSARGDRAPDQWTFTPDRDGKPRLARDDVTRTHLVFNLSHTTGLVACAVGCDLEIGVDVERLDRGADVAALADHFFAPDEAAALRQLDEPHRLTRFMEMWTLKEAFIKAIGEGLSCPLDAFSFTFGDADSLQFTCTRPTPTAAWLFELFAPSREHRMAIAVGTKSLASPMLRVDPFLIPLRTAVTKRRER